MAHMTTDAINLKASIEILSSRSTYLDIARLSVKLSVKIDLAPLGLMKNKSL